MENNILEPVNTKVFSKEQLGKLQEIISSVECECPNHISSIVQSLIDFEDYSEKCFNKNDQDVKIHKYLHSETAKARHIMEQALIKVCEFENIKL